MILRVAMNIEATMKVKRDPIQRKLEVRRGGGCVGAIGSAFAFWFAVFGSTLIIGWRAGDFSTGEFLGFGILIGAFFLCGLGLATYRERFCFDARRRVMIQSRQVLFITYKKQQWSIHNFVAVELSWYRRDVNNKNVWSHVRFPAVTLATTLHTRPVVGPLSH